MTTISKEITIKAPPKEVYSFVEDPTHLPEIWPSMVEITRVEKLPTGGYKYHFVYKMLGMRFTGETVTKKYLPFEQFVEKAEGEITSTFDWRFIPEDGGTRIELEVEYELPKKLLGKFAERFVVKANEREADLVLTNLKERFEL
jgi:ligand-binding SRPBCC domain-containing protein